MQWGPVFLARHFFAMRLLCFLSGWLVFLLLSLNCRGGGLDWAVGGRAASLGGASVTLQDAWAGFNNPAGTAGLNRISLAVSAERRYLPGGPDVLGFGMIVPTSFGSFSANALHFGDRNYNEQRIGLGYARSFGPELSIGMQFNFLGLRIPGYGNRQVFTADVGMRYQPVNDLLLGIRVFNPFRVGMAESAGEEVPVLFSVGAGYAPADGLTLSLQADKSLNDPLQIRAGLEYAILESLSLRAGLSTSPPTLHFGLGIPMKKLDINVGSSLHPLLGFSTTIGIAYSLPEKQP